MDTAAYDGYDVSPYYDSMIAKIIVHGRDRTEAIAKMRTALEEMVVVGVKTNLDFQYAIMENETFAAGLADTSFIERFMKAKCRGFWRGSVGNVQSLKQSCSHETPTGRFGSCGTRLVNAARQNPFARLTSPFMDRRGACGRRGRHRT